jgi:tRNA G18 (ribose-2'-O)-methylase SpoU
MEPEIVIIAHDLRSSHNVGSLIRTAEGLGVKEIILTGYTPYPMAKTDGRLPHIARRVDCQIKKTSLGAEKFISWRHISDLAQAVEGLSREGYVICALEQAPGSMEINKFKPPFKIALMVGNEVKGLSKDVLKMADHLLEIPMFGHKESFNVVQAAAMALYSFRFSRG